MMYKIYVIFTSTPPELYVVSLHWLQCLLMLFTDIFVHMRHKKKLYIYHMRLNNLRTLYNSYIYAVYENENYCFLFLIYSIVLRDLSKLYLFIYVSVNKKKYYM